MHKQGETKTLAILLKKTFLANDDGICEFYTDKFGKISIFIKSLAKSKKKAAELDYFRLSEIVIFEGRNNKTLKTIQTISIFTNISTSYQTMQTGFQWIDKIKNITPEEKPTPKFFSKILKIFSNLDTKNTEKFDTFFRIKCLEFSGIIPRFDQIRGDIYIDPKNFTFSKTKTETNQKLSNTSRQIIEFLRRSDFQTFEKKIQNLPKNNFIEIKKLLNDIEKWHS